MNRFPMSMDLEGKTVFLVGNGPQIRQKAEKLAPFGPELRRVETFTEAEAGTLPALVIVGDTPLVEAGRIAGLCRRYRIPVNVVDVPQLCSFYFPALVTRGELTLSISTAGAAPEAAAWLRRELERLLPENTGDILDWLAQEKTRLRQLGISREAAAAALSAGRPLEEAELQALRGSRD